LGELRGGKGVCLETSLGGGSKKGLKLPRGARGQEWSLIRDVERCDQEEIIPKLERERIHGCSSRNVADKPTQKIKREDRKICVEQDRSGSAGMLPAESSR